jgi:hypothetical protein
MTGDRINRSSDQLKQTNVTGSDKLQAHRNRAWIISEARKNQGLQQGEPAVSRKEQDRYPSSLDSGIQKDRGKKQHWDQSNSMLDPQKMKLQNNAYINSDKRKIDFFGNISEKKMKNSAHSSDQWMEDETPKDSQGILCELANKLKKPGVVTRSQEKNYIQILEQITNDKELIKFLKLEMADERLQLAYLLEKARPKAPDAAEPFLKQLKDIQNILKKGQKNPLLGNEYVKLFEETLQILSPETMQEYQDRKIKFVSTSEKIFNRICLASITKKNELLFPTEYSKPLPLLLRTVETLRIEHQQDQVLPSPERRIKVAARVFKVNAMMGKEFGQNIRNYPYAQEYEMYYYDGIRKAFAERSINVRTSQNELMEVGNKYAMQMLNKKYTARPGEPTIFSPMGPAIYFEEKKRAREKIKEGQKPSARIGTDEFYEKIKEVCNRKKNRINSSLIFNITANKDMLFQHYFFSEDETNLHSQNANGSPCLFSGVIDIQAEIKDGEVNKDKLIKLLSVSDQSGHFRTRDENDCLRAINYAINELKAKGFDTSDVIIEKVEKYGRDLPYHLPE